jgi:hypothetical protein
MRYCLWLLAGVVFVPTLFAQQTQPDAVQGTSKEDSGFGVITGTIPARDAAGKTLHLRGYIRTRGVDRGYAGLWARVDGPDLKVLAFDNMRDRGVKGTTEWGRYDVELPVAANAVNINFGGLFAGSGSAWFDHFELDLDGVPFTSPKIDFDFESNTPLGFFAGGEGYGATLDRDIHYNGAQSVRLDFGGKHQLSGAMPQTAGMATGSLPAAAAAGKQIKFSGYIKTDRVENGRAGLWFRADRPNSSPAVFKNLGESSPKGTTGWTRYEMEVAVPKETININFGGLLQGTGTAWFDGLEISIDGEPYTSASLDLGFEGSGAKGFYTGGDGYGVILDKAEHQEGSQSLRLQYGGKEKVTPPKQVFGGITSKLPVSAAAGKTIHFSGYIKTDDVREGYAGFWWRADDKDHKTMIFKNLLDLAPTGTTDWKLYEIEIDIPAEADNIYYGALLTGTGRAWFDSPVAEIDGAAYPDIDFQVRGSSGVPYTVTRDSTVIRKDRPSLLIQSQ